MKYLINEGDFLSLVFEYISDIEYDDIESWLNDNNYLTNLLYNQILNTERELLGNALIAGSYNSIDILIEDLTKGNNSILKRLQLNPMFNHINHINPMNNPINNFHIERYFDILIYVINIYQKNNKINNITIKSIKKLISTIQKNELYDNQLIKELDDRTKIISNNIEKFIGIPDLYWV